MSFLKRKTDPSNAIERELNDHERRLAARRLQLQEAEQAATAAAAARAQSLADSEGAPDPKLAEAARMTADNAAALRAAVEILTTKVEDARQRLDQERDRAERERLATDLDGRADVIERAASELANRLAAVGTAYANLTNVLQEHGIAYEKFGFGCSSRDAARAILAAGIRAFEPASLSIQSELLGRIETDPAAVTRDRQCNPLRDLARRLRAGEVPPVPPASWPRPYERARVPETEVVVAEPIAYIAADGRRVEVPAGGVTVPVPVADAARAAGIGHEPGSAGARAILAELGRPPVPDYAVNARPTGVRTGPPWHDIGVDLSGTAEQKRAAS